MQRYYFLGEKHYLCNKIRIFCIESMVSKADKEQDRRKQLAGFPYDMAKLMFGSVAIGGLSPLYTGKVLEVTNLLGFVIGSIGGCILAYSANRLLKVYNS